MGGHHSGRSLGTEWMKLIPVRAQWHVLVRSYIAQDMTVRIRRPNVRNGATKKFGSGAQAV